MTLHVGEKISLPQVAMTSNKTFTLDNYHGSYLVIYFYPKDSTPGCTTESIGFTEHYNDFAKVNTKILGVSKDSLSSHEKFKAKYNMPFELVADTEKLLCDAFAVLKEKSMFGKKYMGIERSTFVIDKQGKLIKEWRKVKVPGHVEEVLAFIKSLK
ncbi:peroxiredoxin [Cysteiniphilum halobium]|uniref:peroxiredoxin n=1 Tax=Cysteiniphilum halobium TaxID=2219059 RepID=UPI001AAD0F7D|nr:peroxiredoxin [Cysteiniphilum halobium]